MIVDDEPLERQFIREVVKDVQKIAFISEASNGKEAVKKAFIEKPDIIFMDIKLPVMNGIEASVTIKEGLPYTKIVIISAYDDHLYIKEAFQLGAKNYLLKPVQKEEYRKITDKLVLELDRERMRLNKAEQLTGLAQEMMPYVKLGFIMELLSGTISSLEELQDRSAFLNIERLPEIALVVDIDNFQKLSFQKTELQKQLLKQQILQSINESIQEQRYTFCTPLIGDLFIVFMGFQESELEAKKKAANNLAYKIHRDVLAKRLPLTVSVGIGRVCNPLCIVTSYQEALNSLENRLISGGNQVIHIDDVQPAHSSTWLYPKLIHSELKRSLRIGDRDNCCYYLEILLERITIHHDEQHDLVKNMIMELLLGLSREAISATGSSSLPLEKNYIENWSQEINKITQYSQLKEWLTQKVSELAVYVDESRNQQQAMLFNKAKAYLKSNYSRDISLEDAANHVYLSPSYFCRLFKQCVGQTFKDYLTQLRLTEAKRLMLQPGLSIQDIAKNVGYQDARYFSYVFKKHEGLSPSNYQRKVRV